MHFPKRIGISPYTYLATGPNLASPHKAGQIAVNQVHVEKDTFQTGLKRTTRVVRVGMDRERWLSVAVGCLYRKLVVVAVPAVV
jgi:hypothetical protein